MHTATPFSPFLTQYAYVAVIFFIDVEIHIDSNI